jgi:hypothetical protein
MSSTRQIEPETATWYQVWTKHLADFLAGFAASDFSQVTTRPFVDQPTGDTGFPVSVQMENKLVDAYVSGEAFTVDQQIGIQLQANTLESFRRANLSRRQGRRELLAHYQHELGQASRQNNLMLQTMTGTAKIPPPPEA